MFGYLEHLEKNMRHELSAALTAYKNQRCLFDIEHVESYEFDTKIFLRQIYIGPKSPLKISVGDKVLLDEERSWNVQWYKSYLLECFSRGSECAKGLVWVQKDPFQIKVVLGWFCKFKLKGAQNRKLRKYLFMCERKLLDPRVSILERQDSVRGEEVENVTEKQPVQLVDNFVPKPILTSDSHLPDRGNPELSSPGSTERIEIPVSPIEVDETPSSKKNYRAVKKSAGVKDEIFFNSRLNDSQKDAVLKIFDEASFKIHGPPGTGKTTVIVEIIRQIAKKSQSVLICGPSNATIDNIIEKYIEHASYKPFFRVGSEAKCRPELRKFLKTLRELNHILSRLISAEKAREYERRVPTDQVNSDNVTVSANKNPIEGGLDTEPDQQTEADREEKQNPECVKIIFSTLYSSHKIISMLFDWVIIDEFCQCTELEAVMALDRGRNFIIAGDPHQLGPVTHSQMKNDMFETINIDMVLLNTQYRMSSLLMEFSNSYFYKNLILSPKQSNFAIFGISSLLFIDTSRTNAYEQDLDGSKWNESEASLVIEFLYYLKRHQEHLSIGVISPYSAQVDYISENFDIKEDESFQISTVDSFQGQERDVIIFTFVRDNNRGRIGFLKDIKRTNVAITRCKKGLILIGNRKMFQGNEFYEEYMRFIERKGTIIDSREFLWLIRR